MNDDILQHTVAAPVDKISRFGTSTISVLERNWQGRDQISRDIRLTTNLRRPKNNRTKNTNQQHKIRKVT